MTFSEVIGFFLCPPIRLFQMATAFWVSQTLFAAAELEVFTTLEQRPLTKEEFCRALGMELRPGQALLGGLSALGLVHVRAGRYANAPLASQWLVRGKPDYLGDGLIMLGRRLYRPWGKLTQALRTNRPTSFNISVGELFDHLDRRPKELRMQVRGMHALSLIPARALAGCFNFSPYRHLADLGGGSGVYAIEIARRFPRLKATIVDRPAVCPIAQEYVSAAGLKDRLAVEARDIFSDPLPGGADVALLSQVVHDYSPEDSLSLLRHVQEQLPARGVLLLSEWVLREGRTGPLAASLMSLTMVVDTCGGRSYTHRELQELLREAGFHSVTRRPLYGPAQLVIARKT